jgi:DNA polymerase elongation subunit (family B)
MKRFYFDIETGSADETTLALIRPTFEANKTAKDKEVDVKRKQDEWAEDAALDALTGRVLMVGNAIDDGTPFSHVEAEQTMIDCLLTEIGSALDEGGRVIGFNIKSFDLTFLLQRAMILGVHVPTIIRTWSRGRYYWHEQIVDLMEMFNLTSQHVKGHSLKNICRVMGLGDKSDSGRNFAELMARDMEQAKAYCLNDVELTRKLAKRLLQ